MPMSSRPRTGSSGACGRSRDLRSSRSDATSVSGPALHRSSTRRWCGGASKPPPELSERSDVEPHVFDLDVAGPKRDYVGYRSRPPKVVWPNGAAIAVSIVVNYEEGSEYSIPMGDGRNDVLT